MTGAGGNATTGEGEAVTSGTGGGMGEGLTMTSGTGGGAGAAVAARQTNLGMCLPGFQAYGFTGWPLLPISIYLPIGHSSLAERIPQLVQRGLKILRADAMVEHTDGLY